jgi:mxaJ protein
VFDIAMGVRRDDPGLLQEVDAVLLRRRAEVAAILDAYGVPRVDARPGRASRARPTTGAAK